MTDLTVNTPRKFAGQERLICHLPVEEAKKILEGMVVGENSSTGYCQPLTDGDAFLGFALDEADNSLGADGAIDCKVLVRGVVELTVTGGAVATLGATVYATDTNTFSTTDSGSDTAIGKIVQHVSGTKVLVYFEGYQFRSI